MAGYFDSTLDELDGQLLQLRSELSRLEAFRRQFLGLREGESATGPAARSRSTVHASPWGGLEGLA